MAQSPFADYFNHTSSPSACNVSFSSSGYSISTPVAVKAGQELYISYGNHSNDFLLAEYGFILPLDTNIWDEVGLDEYILPLLFEKQKDALKERGFLGQYVLDSSTVCHRTQVALRILVVNARKWERFVDGMEDGEKEQADVDKVLLKVVMNFKRDVKSKLRAVEGLGGHVGTPEQRQTVERRWKQIEALLQAAVNRIKS